MTRLDRATAELEAKRTALLLRDARAVLRRIDVLAAQALALDDPIADHVSEARLAVERVIRELSLRQLTVGRGLRRPR